MEINLKGQMEKRFGIPQDSYVAKLTEISEPFETTKFDSDIRIEKFRIDFDVVLGKGEKVKIYDDDKVTEETMEEIKLPMYLSTKISKGTGTYSNSKLYDLIKAFGLLEELDEKSEEFAKDDDAFFTWLGAHLIGKKCKVLVKNSEKGYSRVADINRVL